MIKQNTIDGQMVFAQVIEASKAKGVKMNVSKGAALYQVSLDHPRFLLRNIDGKIDQCVFENG